MIVFARHGRTVQSKIINFTKSKSIIFKKLNNWFDGLKHLSHYFLFYHIIYAIYILSTVDDSKSDASIQLHVGPESKHSANPSYSLNQKHNSALK